MSEYEQELEAQNELLKQKLSEHQEKLAWVPQWHKISDYEYIFRSEYCTFGKVYAMQTSYDRLDWRAESLNSIEETGLHRCQGVITLEAGKLWVEQRVITDRKLLIDPLESAPF